MIRGIKIILLFFLCGGALLPFTQKEFERHLIQLKKKIPQPGFTIIIQDPFVVIGNGPSDEVRSLASSTVKWAVKRLKHMYFEKNPSDIIDIWLFNGEESYRKYTWEIFKHKPDTPYGYSSSSQKALIMNIATGSGTLVHEMVHPFMESNFPACPAWFNEGLASLYEQCRGEGDRLKGLTNWRLPGLQQAIQKNLLPSFKTLLHTSTTEFYDEDPGTNYAQARYLCYYLQEKGLLIKFYHQFKQNATSDPSGYKTLKRILKVQNLKTFQKNWQEFILQLTY